MDLIYTCIKRPVGVSVGVLLVTLFGVLALFTIPVQLTPTVDIPKITVETTWIGATPQEIESEIVEPQEEQLQSVKGLREMRASCYDNRAEIELEFYNDVDKDVALRDVSDKLRQVAAYPAEVDEPTVQAADTAADSPIAWLMFRPTGDDPNDDQATRMFDFVDDFVKPQLDRIEGVGSTDIYGGMEREVHVLIDAGELAARGLTFRQVEAALREQNADLSAGRLSQGKRDYAIRTKGEFESLDEILDTVIAYTDGGPVYVADVAEVESSFKKQYAFVRNKGEYVLAIPVRREVGANVITVMQGVRDAVERINREVLEPRDDVPFELTQVYDETVYIDQAIAMVRNNMFIGGVLAAAVLMIFLRNWRATAAVALSIPISVIGTFLLVASLGRTLNVISLAGMAFAIGMVVDNAIVVLENIYRHYQMGSPPMKAAHDGAREVWAAVLASTLTTMAVFIPVIFVQEEAGQLFRDISIATVAAVGLSLVVSLTVVPSMATRLLAIGKRPKDAVPEADHDPNEEGAGPIAIGVSRFVSRVNQNAPARLAVIVGLVVGCAALLPFFIPQATYLPTGNRNLVFGFLVAPPGYSIDEFKSIGRQVEQTLAPYWSVEPNSPVKKQLDERWKQIAEQRVPMELAPLQDIPGIEGWLLRGRTQREWRKPPPLVDNFFFVSFSGRCFMGAISADPSRVQPMVRLLDTTGQQIPGVFPIFFQRPIFEIGGGNTAEIQVRGDDLEQVTASAGALFGALQQELGVFPQPTPSNFNLGRPEVQIVPDRERAADMGLNVRDVGFIVEACVEGAYVGDYGATGGDTIDIALKVADADDFSTQQIGAVPIFTPTGQIAPLSSAVQLIDTTSLEQIYRVERQRAVTLQVTPPETMSLEGVIQSINNIVAGLRKQGAIAPDITIAMTGNADKLVKARNVMIGEWQGLTLTTLLNIVSSRFFLSVLIVYLLMAALYESWVYPFVIMFAVPLAVFGGFVGLMLAHWGTLLTTDQPIQQLDVVTFLGFVILVGIVVNNAILLVDQALRNLRERGLHRYEAIRHAVEARVRPIFMTSLTTIAGQIPLALMPAAGSELYRGLAAVMLGGLLVASIGTLLLVPCVLGLVFAIENRMAGERPTAPAAETAAAVTAADQSGRPG